VSVVVLDDDARVFAYSCDQCGDVVLVTSRAAEGDVLAAAVALVEYEAPAGWVRLGEGRPGVHVCGTCREGERSDE
jgi:hypothetical protein